MKHTPPVTFMLVVFFIITQLVGIWLVAAVTPIGAPPPTTTEAAQHSGSLILGIAIGTLLFLGIIRLKLVKVWKAWFFLAVTITVAYSLSVYLMDLAALVLAGLLAAWKIFKPNIIVHNITEILVYSGIAVLVAVNLPLDVGTASVILAAVSVYDAYAVYKSKHMIKFAKFQTDSKLFAGLVLPYKKPKIPKEAIILPKEKETEKKPEKKVAILGGGDLAFPLLFITAVLQWLISEGFNKGQAIGLSIIIVGTASMALLTLFTLAEQDRFYPAMPLLSVGCFSGLALMLGLISFIA